MTHQRLLTFAPNATTTTFTLASVGMAAVAANTVFSVCSIDYRPVWHCVGSGAYPIGATSCTCTGDACNN